jgi:hypothetical protein
LARPNASSRYDRYSCGERSKTAIRAVLGREGYTTSAERGIGETGTDIIAERGREVLHIESISFKTSPPARAKDFYEAFFRAVSRLEHKATACVIALPSRFGMGLPQRAQAIGVAWHRIGKAFPELEIWLVDTTEWSIQKTAWNSWIKRGGDGPF